MEKNLGKIILILVFVVLLVGVATVTLLYFVAPEPPSLGGNGLVEYDQVEETTPSPTEAPRTILPELVELYQENSDLAGWITIDDTVVDYPVMYTPDDYDKYLYMAFDGSYSVDGSIIMEANCTYDPHNDEESMNLILHGHNMRDGSMFRTLTRYKNQNFWEQHPTITFRTLYEEREYEVLATFPDRIYYTYEDCFKFYQFIDPADEAAFNEGIEYFKANSDYDTGVTATYGDRLLTLVTCDYHEADGRYVVVAREIKDKIPETLTNPEVGTTVDSVAN